MKQYFIVADDFTGSNDTGVQLTRRGIQTRVVLDPKGIRTDDFSYVLDTESRNLPGPAAQKKTATLLEGVDLSTYDCVIKKVDSTLRGNIAEELLEIERAFHAELVIFMPALPVLGRTTKNSIHMLGNTRICETELAHDPRKPVLEDNIAEILHNAFHEPVSALSLSQIRKKEINLDSSRLWACDAETNADMRAVITAARKSGKRTLWVGTAAMADNLLVDDYPENPALAVIASVSDVARAQIHFAEEKGICIQQVDIADLIGRGDREAPVCAAVKALQAGNDLIFVSSASYNRDALDASLSAGAEQGMSRDEVAEFAGKVVAELTAAILDSVKVSGLFLSGGDTAIHFFDLVEATGSEILSEMSVGIPIMRLEGGRFNGLKVITKAGAFGSTDELPTILRKLCES